MYVLAGWIQRRGHPFNPWISLGKDRPRLSATIRTSQPPSLDESLNVLPLSMHVPSSFFSHEECSWYFAVFCASHENGSLKNRRFAKRLIRQESTRVIPFDRYISIYFLSCHKNVNFIFYYMRITTSIERALSTETELSATTVCVVSLKRF